MEILKRENFPGFEFDTQAGYSCAVKVGNMVFVGGTSATNSDGDVEGGADAYRQARIIFRKIETILKRAGAGMRNVVRVRFYVTDIASGQSCLSAYSEWFKDIRPVVTMLEVKALARVSRVLEVEVDAIIGSYHTTRLT